MLELVVSSQLNRAVGSCTSSQLLVIIVPNCWGTYHFLFPTEVPICCLQITTMFTRYFHIPILPISFYYPHVVNYIPMVGNNLIFPIPHCQLDSPGWQLAGSYYWINKQKHAEKTLMIYPPWLTSTIPHSFPCAGDVAGGGRCLWHSQHVGLRLRRCHLAGRPGDHGGSGQRMGSWYVEKIH